MTMIQHSVSVGASALDSPHGSETSIGRILDWIEARIAAIKAREEEEEEDEEPEKEKERAKVALASSRADANKDTTTSVSFPSNLPHKQPQTAYRPVDETVRLC